MPTHTKCTRCGNDIKYSAAVVSMHVPNNPHEEPPVLQLCDACKRAFLNWCLEGKEFLSHVAPAIEDTFRKRT